jgi:hypothetical protein
VYTGHVPSFPRCRVSDCAALPETAYSPVSSRFSRSSVHDREKRRGRREPKLARSEAEKRTEVVGELKEGTPGGASVRCSAFWARAWV